MKQRGFTVIELLVTLVVLIVAIWLYIGQHDTVTAVQRDAARKVSINAMYYNLEEVYYPQNSYYPQTIDSKTLRAMDPSLFTDPFNIKMGESDADYRYDATGCSTDGHCTGYTLTSDMEREADFTKTNRSHTDN